MEEGSQEEETGKGPGNCVRELFRKRTSQAKARHHVGRTHTHTLKHTLSQTHALTPHQRSRAPTHIF